MFEWEMGCCLTHEDFVIKEREAYIDGFILSNSITLIYSSPKQGKTWLSYAIAKRLCGSEKIKRVYYLDMDNPIAELGERGVGKHFLDNPKMSYISKAKIGVKPLLYLRQIALAAGYKAYEGILFFLDTTKDFVQMSSPAQAEEFMGYCKDIRDAGGTLIILHHATKNGQTISGDQAFISSPDNVYEMKQTGNQDGVLTYALSVTHARGKVMDITCSVDTATLEYMEADTFLAGLEKFEEEFVVKVIEALRCTPEGLNKSAALSACGCRRDDKTAGAMLERWVGRFWEMDTYRKQKIFKLKEADSDR